MFYRLNVTRRKEEENKFARKPGNYAMTSTRFKILGYLCINRTIRQDNT